jgi:hypothetical protein
MSVAAEDPLPDDLALDANMMKALRDSKAVLNSFPAGVQMIADRREIDEALDTWLGQDLLTLEHDGHPLWTGNSSDLDIREARTDEAEQWHTSRRQAIDREEIDAGQESWLLFLVQVSEPE